jgi:hypothetical protein
MQLELIMEEYRSEIKESKKTNHGLKKEWTDEEAAAHVGGPRCWPPWDVQIICKMLVNGTSPLAVPSAMQTMYEMLTGDVPKELTSVSFVQSCRVVVEGIRETIVAMKLADASSWSLLWTDGTTRRQIPFTTLVAGLIEDDDNINPVVVSSSCIFMEDKRSEMQANGIIIG